MAGVFEIAGVAGSCVAVLGAEASEVRAALMDVAGLGRRLSYRLVIDGAPFAGKPGSLDLGMGVVSGVLDVNAHLTVEECVTRELGLVRRRGARRMDEDAVLEYLGRFGLATQVDRYVGDLMPVDRGRLSAALAFAEEPRVACVDLADAFCAGMAAADGVSLVDDLARIAGACETCVLLGTVEPAFARVTDSAVCLDVQSEEALAVGGVA